MKNDWLQSGDANLLLSIRRFDWRLENSDAGTMVAYQLAPGEAPLQKLLERLGKNLPGVLMLSRDPGKKLPCPIWIVREGMWAEALGELCDRFYPLPIDLKLLAVTGTNGKTTTADLVLQIGEMAGLKGFSLGTLGVRQAGHTLEEFGLTTPGQVQLRQLLHQYGANSNFCVMEVSSHALEQDRIHGMTFDGAAWTSFTQDHLDYHGSMEAYFRSKLKITEYLKAGAHLFVPEGQQDLLSRLRSVKALQEVPQLEQVARQRLPVFFKTRFNEENLACAIALAKEMGIAAEKISFETLLPPPGRFYIREWDGKTAIVDFAHTPDALENILRAIKETFPSHHVITLFGCGGDRDRTKRPKMGAIAAKWSHEVIVTSDNPRTEDPERIIQDIVDGVGQHTLLKREVDRPVAVRTALANLRSGDVLLMAGKGHEDYILKGTVKVPYSDIVELDNFIAGKGKKS